MRQPAAGVIGMRPPWIAAQIGPVALTRVGERALAPGRRLAPRRDDGADAPGERVVRIGGEKILVAAHRVAGDGGEIGLTGIEFPDRPRAQLREALGLRRRALCPLEEQERRFDPRDVPGELGALGQPVHPQTYALEQVVELEPALLDHFGQGRRIGAVALLGLGSDRAGRRVEGEQHPGIGLGQSKAAGERLACTGEAVLAGGVEHDDPRLQRQPGKRPDQIAQADRLERHVAVAGDAGIDRNEIVLALELQPVSGEIDEGHGVGPGSIGLVDELAQRGAEGRHLEVARPDDVEARRLQGLRDEAGIIGRTRQGASLIGAVADDERNPLLERLRLRMAEADSDEKRRKDQSEKLTSGHRALPQRLVRSPGEESRPGPMNRA